MHLLLVNLYEFGLFLRIILWISVPLIVVALLVTTWLHYRSRRRGVDELRLAMEGMELSAKPEELLAAIQGRRMLVEAAGGEEAGSGESAEGGDSATSGEEEQVERERNRMYKGILWMKEKYEQYRDLADQRIEQLKDELVRSEKRYQDLLDQRMDGRDPERAEGGAPETLVARAEAGTPDVAEEMGRQLAEKGRQIEEKDHQLESRDRRIEDLENQLQTQAQKTEELVSKLQNSSQLLLKISQELDGSLPPVTQPQAQAEARPS